ncbi:MULTISPECIES: DUF4233 domain-containing protein [Streptomyces]|uniref:Uncharacterized protein n=3 Tax=Streptomyces TaxID=1883 RepID=A0A1I6UPP3_9ACTN|nr:MULTISPECIES: DUF4233 domain-containing protein [Streptomyces]MCK1813168.1 DUF4233 domain-containing protein [Streptomyces sp. XM4011]QKV69128.1 DUF4233 domain-containing protein [Streptomyces harbinensis]UWM49156.1 DUF4233 domain-containing protein [Streptomyces carpaticus]SFT03373.1 Protein of unknown function [Streptomyces harbinensis]
MRTLCASTLISEVLVIGLAGLVAVRLTDTSATTIWAVSGTAMVLCLLLCGWVTRPGGVQFGWALQIALIASGFVVPAMFVLGVIFAGLWWASVHFGRKVDEIKAAHAAGAAAVPQ